MPNHGGKRTFEEIKLVLTEKKQSPLGNLILASTRHGVYAVAFGVKRSAFLSQIARRTGRYDASWSDGSHPALDQVADYLAGKRQHFTIDIDYSGLTAFQVQVYQAVVAVPYGQTATYGQIAKVIGRPRAARAVGAANGANPLPILIPCHRLVGSDGSLRGYGGTGGLDTKRWLLDLESSHR